MYVYVLHPCSFVHVMHVYIPMQISTLSNLLEKIQQGVGTVKLTRQNANSKGREILKVLKNHTSSSDYAIQFFKQPRVDNCDCKACGLDMFQPLRMPASVYKKLHTEMRMPLPIPTVLHGIDDDGTEEDREDKIQYLPLTESMRRPFTDEHQPSLIARAKARRQATHSVACSGNGRGFGRGQGGRGGFARGRGGRGGSRHAVAITLHSQEAATIAAPIETLESMIHIIPNKKDFSIGKAANIRGLVLCNEPTCKKPRCIYSHKAPSTMQPAAPFTPQEESACRC